MTDLTSEKRLSGEPPGTILLGSIDKRCYLFVCQSALRMQVERANARAQGIQDPIDFVFEFDGQRFELSYEDLWRRIVGPVCFDCGGIIKATEGGVCRPCSGEKTT